MWNVDFHVNKHVKIDSNQMKIQLTPILVARIYDKIPEYITSLPYLSDVFFMKRADSSR